MKKTMLSLLFSFVLIVFAAPAFAQHGHGGSRGGHQSQPQHDPQGRGVQHDNERSEQQFHQNNPREGYHYAEPRSEFRGHWDGRRFDHPFFESHWGYGHPFYWGHAGWYGPRWRVGSYFWFGGAYFSIIDPIPPTWYDGTVVVIYDDSCDCYYAVNQAYPGVRIHIGIRF